MVSLLAVFAVSCEKEEPPGEVPYAAYIPENGAAAVYFGNVSIRTTENNEVLILADIRDAVQETDGIAEISFVLQRRPHEGEAISLDAEGVRIVKNERSLSIIPAGLGEPLWFGLDPSGLAVTGHSFTGYGLSQNMGRWDMSMAFLDGFASVFDALCTYDFHLKDVPGGGSGTCPSGGPGSVSCTSTLAGGIFGVTGTCTCSVSCGSGSYACCCHCQKCICVLNGASNPCNAPAGGN